MSDETQLEQIAEVIEDLIRDSGGSVYIHAVTGAADRIMDICQPQWIPVTERLPDAEPHRTIEIACISPYPDDEKSPFSIHVSTKIPVTAFEGSYAWREVVLPIPEDTA